ncbi:MAG: hypothetical protein IJ880_01180 [Bacilli bacterium]|nr:hypothetical protein [Bacilli bacterium]
MKELKYNICYNLGDVYGDGHGGYEIKHLVSNYPAGEIDKAYQNWVLKTGLDFTKDVCDEYEDHSITDEQLDILKKTGVIDDEYIKENLEYDNDYWFDLDTYIDVFERIIRTELPDFAVMVRDLEEEAITCINYAAYGLTENC